MIPTNESANLDILRATAVSIVAAFHLLMFFGYVNHDLGGFGVLLFFVHTTLVLMFSLGRQEARNLDRPLFGVFMLRRVFRIYPLSILAVCLTFLFSLPTSDIQKFSMTGLHFTWRNFLTNLVLVQNLTGNLSAPSVLWSLPYEMQMYLFLPVLYLFAKRTQKLMPFLLMWVAALFLNWTRVRVPYLPPMFGILAFIPCFLPGVMAFVLWQRKRVLPFWLWPLWLAIITGTYLAASKMATLACLVVGLTVPMFAEMPNCLLRRAAALVAKYSYGVYVTHMFCMWVSLVVLRRLPVVAQLAVFLTMTAGLSVALYHLVEEPLIRVGVRVAESRIAVQPAVAQAASAD